MLVPGIVKKNNIQTVVANAENAAGGSGITPAIANELFESGIHIITSGDHIWKRKEIVDTLEKERNLLRPLNYPKGAPGSGSTIIELRGGIKLCVINLIGRVFMQPVECPFRACREEIDKVSRYTHNIFVDVHAEATSEKIALGWYLDGMATAVMGTHTHVQTADEKVLPEGTAYITDVGMTGPFDSVIGRKKEQILTRFITQMPARFQMAEDDIWLNGAVIDFDESSGKAKRIARIQERYM